MVPYLGDYDTTETVVIPFNTFTSDDPSASSTITNLAAGDVEIHKDGGVTQRSSDAGVTVTIDFDSVTGNHIVSIDLSDDTDSGFYAAGSRYQVRIEGTTIDAGTVNAWIGTFSIGCVLRPTTDGRTLDVTSTGAAGIDWANVENQSTAVDLSATDIQLADTVTTLSGHTAQTGDTYALANGSAGFVAIDTVVDTILADTNELQTDWADGGRLDLILDARASQVSVDTIDGIVDSILVDTGTTIPSTLTAIAAYIDTEVAAILVDTGTTIPGLIATAQADLDIITGADGVNILSATQASIDAIEADTNELQTNQGNWATATGFSTHNAAAVLAAGDIDGYSLEKTLKLCLAALSGKLSGAATTTIAIRAADDSKDRITATVDSDGNRTAVTLDGDG